jgi:hypothetical protein
MKELASMNAFRTGSGLARGHDIPGLDAKLSPISRSTSSEKRVVSKKRSKQHHNKGEAF